MTWNGRWKRVQGGREPAAPSELAEYVHQRHESADDDVAEHHVKQQLSVGPSGAVAAAAQVMGVGSVDELMKVGLRPADFGGDVVAVHQADLRCSEQVAGLSRRLFSVERRGELVRARRYPVVLGVMAAATASSAPGIRE